MEKTLRQRITDIKNICAKQGLPLSEIMKIISESGEYVSERTVQRILSKGSEDMSFQYHSVVAVYEALIDKYGDMPDIQDIEVLRKMVTDRDKQIDRLIIYGERKEEEHEQRDGLYADRKHVFETTIEILKEQLAVKDEEIKRQAELIDKLVGRLVERG